MSLFAQGIRREDLQPGDHIYSYRLSFQYSHHGIYMGDGEVIHFGPRYEPDEGTSSNSIQNIVKRSKYSCSTSNRPCIKCYPDMKRPEGVTKCCLNCFISAGDLNIFEYGVSKTFFVFKIRCGTCSIAKSDPPQLVLHRAYYLYHINGFGRYSIWFNNCEDFARYCKTGLIVKTNGIGSSQVACFLAKASALSPAIPITIPSIVGYQVARYEFDVGYGRKNYRQVTVEELVKERATTTHTQSMQQLEYQHDFSSLDLSAILAKMIRLPP